MRWWCCWLQGQRQPVVPVHRLVSTPPSQNLIWPRWDQRRRSPVVAVSVYQLDRRRRRGHQHSVPATRRHHWHSPSTEPRRAPSHRRPSSRWVVVMSSLSHMMLIHGIICYVSLSILTAIFPGEPGLDGFNGAKDDGSGGDNWSCKTCKASVKSLPPTSSFFTGRMPFLSPNQQRQSNEGLICLPQGIVSISWENSPLSPS